jgi:membrane protease YdiL (CAAX protease family)
MGLFFAGSMLGVAMIATLSGSDIEQAQSVFSRSPLALGIVQLVALGTVLLVGKYAAYGTRPFREALGVHRVPISVILLSILAGLAFHFPLVELMTLLTERIPELAPDAEAQQRIEELTRIDSVARAIAVWLTVVGIAASTEELVFRGLFLPALRPKLGRAGALALTSLLFGAFHMEPFAVIYASIAGLLLGVLVIRTGSVLVSIAFHAAFNAVPLLLPESFMQVPGFNVAESEAHMPPLLVFGASAVFFVSMLCLFRLTRNRVSDASTTHVGTSREIIHVEPGTSE